MQGFTLLKLNRLTGHPDQLITVTYQVHFDTPELLIIEGTMIEAFKVKVTLKLSIDMGKQIFIKHHSNLLRVVIGCIENSRIFLQIDPDKQPNPGTDLFTHRFQ